MHPTTVSDKPGECRIARWTSSRSRHEPEGEAGSAAPRGRRAAPRSPSRPSARRCWACAARRCARCASSRPSARSAGSTVDERRLAPRPHEVRGLRRAPLRGLHRQVRAEGRPPALDLQPRAGRDAAGVPAGAARAEAARRRARSRRSPRAARTCSRRRASGSALWDIRAADIAELERTGTGRGAPSTCYAEVGGFVDAEERRAGHARDAGRHALRHRRPLAGLGPGRRLRVGPPSVRLGHAGRVTLSYLPGRELARAGHLHRADGRGEDAHGQGAHRGRQAGGALKPDMFADVLLRADMGRGLVVPDSAVIDTGDRKLVFLDRGDGADRAARGRDRRRSRRTATRCCGGSRRATAS